MQQAGRDEQCDASCPLAMPVQVVAKADVAPGSIASAITATRQQPVVITLPPTEGSAAPGSK